MQANDEINSAVHDLEPALDPEANGEDTGPGKHRSFILAICILLMVLLLEYLTFIWLYSRLP